MSFAVISLTIYSVTNIFLEDTMQNILFMLISVSLSAGRSIFSKKVAADYAKKEAFFFSQTVLFLTAAIIIFITEPPAFRSVAPQTLLFGIIYGIILIAAQWLFTYALRSGPTSICTVVYSFGFIFPTLSGTIFWGEDLTVFHAIGLVIAIAVIILSAKPTKDETAASKRYVLYIVLAMLGGGGLGIMQKVQQTSEVAAEKSAFLIIGFLLAFFVSLIAFLTCRKPIKIDKALIYPVLTGGCYSGMNLLNTILVGRMKSAVFFPVQNISSILLTTLCGIVLFKEKLTPRSAAIILLGIAAVLVLSL